MRRFKDRVAVADVSTRSNTQPANLCRTSVRDVVAIQVGSSEHVILLRANDHLLEDRISDAVINQQLLFPYRIAVSAIEIVERRFDLSVDCFLEIFRSVIQARFNHLSVFLDREIRIGVLVA